MFIKAKGVVTHYQVIGKSEQILVFLHGWGCNWQTWSPLIQPLAQKNQLFLLDLPAFGKSDNPPENWDSKQYVDWLIVFIDQVIKNKNFILFGHSFGGKLAALYASQPESRNLKKLILIDSAGIPDQLTKLQKIKQQLINFIPRIIKDRFSIRLKRKILTKLNLATDYLNANQQQKAILKQIIQENISQQLLLIKVPTLIIWGEDDLDTPVHQAAKFQQQIKNSNLEILKDAGHYSFIDQTEQFLKIIRNFI